MTGLTWLFLAALAGSSMAPAPAAPDSAPVVRTRESSPGPETAVTDPSDPVAGYGRSPTAASAPEPAVPAEQPAKPSVPAKPALDGEWAILVAECKPSEEQMDKLVKVKTTAETEVAAWKKTNAEKLRMLQMRLTTAQQLGDPDGARLAWEEARPLVGENQAMRARHQAAIMDVLTPAQRLTWHGYRLCQDLALSLRTTLGLSSEQEKQLRPLCDAAAKEVAGAKVDTEEGLKVHKAAEAKLLAALKETVLTDYQRKRLEAIVSPGSPATNSRTVLSEDSYILPAVPRLVR
jgi:hypothetical protein